MEVRHGCQIVLHGEDVRVAQRGNALLAVLQGDPVLLKNYTTVTITS